MCLAVPGKLVAWIDREEPFRAASVEFGGIRRQVSMACVPQAEVGDYVLVHAGIAIGRIDPEEAARVFEALRELELVDEPGDEPVGQMSMEHESQQPDEVP